MAFQPFQAYAPVGGVAAPPPHHPLCQPAFQRDSGISAHGRDVVHKYFELNAAAPESVTFQLDCEGCCAAYLQHQRGYTPAVTGGHSRVEFQTAGAPLPANFTYVQVRDSESMAAANAQLATFHDSDLENPGPLVAQGGYTYQIYGGGANGEMALGLVGQVRLERIALLKVRKPKLSLVRTSVADGAIQELYRQKIGQQGVNAASLQGQVILKQAPAAPAAAASTAEGKPKKKDSDDEEDIDEAMSKIFAKMQASAPKTPAKKAQGSAPATPASATK